MDIAQYVKSLNEGREDFPDVLSYAVDERVPVMDSDALAALKHLIRIKGARTYLEIGTAIGYSGLHLLSVYPDSHLTTIEKDQESYEKAIRNFSKYGVASRVDARLDDAKTIHPDMEKESFDLLFIDASKGNNQFFFDKFLPFVKEDGLIVVDNILLRGLVVKDEIIGRNKRKLKEKVDAFNQNMSRSDYPTSFLPIGDGLLVISKSQV